MKKFLAFCFVAILSVGSLALAGRTTAGISPAFTIEQTFDGINIDPSAGLSSFSFKQHGVVVTITANNDGVLSCVDGVLTTSDLPAGLTVTVSSPLDLYHFYGPACDSDPATLSSNLATQKGGVFMQAEVLMSPDDNCDVGTNVSHLNKIVGFVLTGAGLDELMFQEYGR